MPRGRKKAAENKKQQIEPTVEAREPGDEIESLSDQGLRSPVNDTVVIAGESTSDSMEHVGNSEATFESKPDGTRRMRFRSWVTDNARGYSRKTDDQYQMIVVQFDQKPSPEILSALKDGSFHYHPDYAGNPRAWVRRNDHTGRVQAEAIEKLVRSQSPGVDSPTPF
jgi:hypothetical protein